MMKYVYIAECADGTFYTGWTTDLQRRLDTHNAGRGAKYTRSRLPVKFVYAHAYADQRTAMQQEYAMKQLTRAEKERRIAGCENQITALLPLDRRNLD